MREAKGPFLVRVTPRPPADPPDIEGLNRHRIEKQYQGDLEGTARGEMLSHMTKVKGSAGYVAQEHVTAMLHGRVGTFVLQHVGTMEKGATSLTVTIVPDSGTEELEGIRGEMTIDIADGKHAYTLRYELPK